MVIQREGEEQKIKGGWWVVKVRSWTWKDGKGCQPLTAAEGVRLERMVKATVKKMNGKMLRTDRERGLGVVDGDSFI